MNFLKKIISTTSSGGPFLVRIVVGLIFLSEGIQKYLFPETVGTARFVSIGFQNPAFWAYFTATFEVICGWFVLIGFLGRIFSVPLLIIMITAFVTTKLPIFMEDGFWDMAHHYRTDFALTILLVYLLIYGSGKFSFDLYLGLKLKRKSNGKY